jgi:hypothetical protein
MHVHTIPRCGLGTPHTMRCALAQSSGASVSALKGTEGVPSIMSLR